MRGPLLFILNFHPTDSYERYSVGVEEAGEYQVSFNVYICNSFIVQICIYLFILYHCDLGTAIHTKIQGRHLA